MIFSFILIGFCDYFKHGFGLTILNRYLAALRWRRHTSNEKIDVVDWLVLGLQIIYIFSGDASLLQIFEAVYYRRNFTKRVSICCVWRQTTFASSLNVQGYEVGQVTRASKQVFLNRAGKMPRKRIKRTKDQWNLINPTNTCGSTQRILEGKSLNQKCSGTMFFSFDFELWLPVFSFTHYFSFVLSISPKWLSFSKQKMQTRLFNWKLSLTHPSTLDAGLLIKPLKMESIPPLHFSYR